MHGISRSSLESSYRCQPIFRTGIHMKRLQFILAVNVSTDTLQLKSKS